MFFSNVFKAQKKEDHACKEKYVKKGFVMVEGM